MLKTLLINRYIDALESNLGREMENGRLFRLVCKLGFINERPEYAFLCVFCTCGKQPLYTEIDKNKKI
jgi:hypothetical protein